MKYHHKVLRKLKHLNKNIQFVVVLFFVLAVTAVASVSQMINTSNFDLRQQAADDPGGGGGLYAPTNTPTPVLLPIGSLCNNDSQCSSNFCQDGFCQPISNKIPTATPACSASTATKVACEMFAQECIPDGNCWKPKPDPTNTPIPTKKPDYSSCSSNSECQSNICQSSLCRPIPTNTPIPGVPTAIPTPPSLGTCSTSVTCQSSLGCDCPSNCVKSFATQYTSCGGIKGAENTLCSSNSDCQSGLTCQIIAANIKVCKQYGSGGGVPTATPTPKPTCQSQVQCQKYGDICTDIDGCWQIAKLEGNTCSRTVECAAGLLCANNICTRVSQVEHCYSFNNCQTAGPPCVCIETSRNSQNSCSANQYFTRLDCQLDADYYNNEIFKKSCTTGSTVCIADTNGNAVSQSTCNSDGKTWSVKACSSGQICKDNKCYSSSTLSSCTTPCLSTSGCSCPTGCYSSSVQNYGANCGGTKPDASPTPIVNQVLCQTCLAVNLGKPENCPSECLVLITPTPTFAPLPQLGTCSTSVTCQNLRGCSCPENCADADRIVEKGQSCGGLIPSLVAEKPFSTATQCADHNGDQFGCITIGCQYSQFTGTCGATYGISKSTLCSSATSICGSAILGSSCVNRNEENGYCARNPYADEGDESCVCETISTQPQVEVAQGNLCPDNARCICRSSGNQIQPGEYCPLPIANNITCPINSPQPGCWCNLPLGKIVRAGETCRNTPEEVAKFAGELVVGGLAVGAVPYVIPAYVEGGVVIASQITATATVAGASCASNPTCQRAAGYVMNGVNSIIQTWTTTDPSEAFAREILKTIVPGANLIDPALGVFQQQMGMPFAVGFVDTLQQQTATSLSSVYQPSLNSLFLLEDPDAPFNTTTLNQTQYTGGRYGSGSQAVPSNQLALPSGYNTSVPSGLPINIGTDLFAGAPIPIGAAGIVGNSTFPTIVNPFSGIFNTPQTILESGIDAVAPGTRIQANEVLGALDTIRQADAIFVEHTWQENLLRATSRILKPGTDAVVGINARLSHAIPQGSNAFAEEITSSTSRLGITANNNHTQTIALKTPTGNQTPADIQQMLITEDLVATLTDPNPETRKKFIRDERVNFMVTDNSGGGVIHSIDLDNILDENGNIDPSQIRIQVGTALNAPENGVIMPSDTLSAIQQKAENGQARSGAQVDLNGNILERIGRSVLGRPSPNDSIPQEFHSVTAVYGPQEYNESLPSLNGSNLTLGGSVLKNVGIDISNPDTVIMNTTWDHRVNGFDGSTIVGNTAIGLENNGYSATPAKLQNTPNRFVIELPPGTAELARDGSRAVRADLSGTASQEVLNLGISTHTTLANALSNELGLTATHMTETNGRGGLGVVLNINSKKNPVEAAYFSGEQRAQIRDGAEGILNTLLGGTNTFIRDASTKLGRVLDPSSTLATGGSDVALYSVASTTIRQDGSEIPIKAFSALDPRYAFSVAPQLDPETGAVRLFIDVNPSVATPEQIRTIERLAADTDPFTSTLTEYIQQLQESAEAYLKFPVNPFP